jgi:hypothetical protein
VTPSTSLAISSPNSSLTSSSVVSVSSTTSWRSAAAIVSSSSLRLARNQRHPVGVVDEVLTGAPLLPFVGVRRKAKRPAEQVAVDVRVVGRDLCEQLLNEALISLVKLYNCHAISVLRGFARTCPGGNDVVTGKVNHGHDLQTLA